MDSTKKNNYFIFLLFTLLYIFLLYLNYIFPTQADDLGKPAEGFKGIVRVYTTWNARFGELIKVSFGSYFSKFKAFSFLNSLIGSLFIFLLYFNIFGYLPKKSSKEICLFSVLVIYLIIDPVYCFGAVFFWAAGSFNYLWGWTLILIWAIPIILFWRNYNLEKYSLYLILFEILFGIPAGWSSEFCIVLVLLIFISIVYSFIRKIKLPLWYYVAFFSFLAGWVILYMAPGLRVRAMTTEGYMSIKEILQLGVFGIIKRVIWTFDSEWGRFYYEVLLIESIFLIISNFADYSTTKIKSIFLSFCEIIILIISLFLVHKFLFILLSASLFLIKYFLYKEKNKDLALFYLVYFIAIFIEMIFIASTIQLPSLTRRAKLQYVILNYIMIAVAIKYFYGINFIKNNHKIKNIISLASVILLLGIAGYVCFECHNMTNKWNLMVSYIEEQKSNGITNIIVDENTFESSFIGYNSWGTPGDNPVEWPNNVYAKYFGVETFIAK